MDDKVKKHIEKTWKKENGKILLLEEYQFGYQLVIYKSGKKATARKIHFTFNNNSEVKEKALKFKPNDRVKCRYVAYSKEHKGRWYTNLELKDIIEWKVNEKKQAMDDRQKQREADNKYKNSLFGNDVGNSQNFETK